VIQFAEPLAAAQLQAAGGLIADRPDVQLYVYGDASTNLDFLRYFGTLRRLQVALYKLEDITGFSHVRYLEELTFGETKRTFSLRFLGALPHLKALFLVGHKKDLPAICDLSELTDLGFSQITLSDLSLILPLTKLRKFKNLLGGTRNFNALGELPELEELFLMRITKLSDLSALRDIKRLKSLRLDWMRNVTALPSFAALPRLENVELDTMKELTDLSPIAAAPALRPLSVGGIPRLTAESFRCFLGHPALKELWAYTGKSTVNEAIKQMLPGIAR
jgi:internalin A